MRKTKHEYEGKINEFEAIYFSALWWKENMRHFPWSNISQPSDPTVPFDTIYALSKFSIFKIQFCFDSHPRCSTWGFRPDYMPYFFEVVVLGFAVQFVFRRYYYRVWNKDQNRKAA